MVQMGRAWRRGTFHPKEAQPSKTSKRKVGPESAGSQKAGCPVMKGEVYAGEELSRSTGFGILVQILFSQCEDAKGVALESLMRMRWKCQNAVANSGRNQKLTEADAPEETYARVGNPEAARQHGRARRKPTSLHVQRWLSSAQLRL